MLFQALELFWLRQRQRHKNDTEYRPDIFSMHKGALRPMLNQVG